MARSPKSEYAKKLLDPRWQKKRLDILNRDGFKCRACESSTKTLHVHHCFYEWGKDPWDYANDSLVTLCVDCHEEESALSSEAKRRIWEVFAIHGVLASPVDDLACGIYDRIRRNGAAPMYVARMLAAIVNYDELWVGASAAYDEWWTELEAFGSAVADETDADGNPT